MEPVSVVIPTYNRAARLPSTIDSVLGAVDGGDEIIVVDDGSTDATEELLRRYGERLRYLKLPNRGAGAARNSGVAACSYDLVAFADSDDLWLPQRLLWERPLLARERSLVFVFSDFGYRHTNGQLEMSYVHQWSDDPSRWDAILGPTHRLADFVGTAGADVAVHFGSLSAAELITNYISVNTLLVRKSLAGDALHFAEDLPTYEEWECFARISRRGACAYIDAPTAIHCAHDGPRLTDASSAVRLATRLRIIERTLGSGENLPETYIRILEDTADELSKMLARH